MPFYRIALLCAGLLGPAGLLFDSPRAGAAPAASDSRAPRLFGQPPEVVAHQADLIVVGSISSVEPARKVTHTPAGASEPVTRNYSRCVVSITRVIKRPSEGPDSQINQEGTAAFECLAVPSDRGILRPNVVLGISYILLLQRAANLNVYVLPYGADYRLDPDKEAIQALIEAVKLENWPWGPEANGLRCAMVCKWTEWPHTIRNKETVFFRAFLAVRNVSKQPLRLNLAAADTPIWVEARHADGRAVKADLYRQLQWRMKGKLAAGSEVLPPGKAVFVGLMGKEAVQFDASMDLAAGPWTIHAGYRNQRKGGDPNAFWVGDVPAKPLEIEVLTLSGQ